MIPAPTDNFLVWAMENREAIVRSLDFLNRLEAAVVQLTPGAGSTGAGTKLLSGDSNLIIPIPIKFTRPIVAPTGGTTVDAECRAVLAALLSALTQNGQNPR
jgi:hypothetical protein